MTEVGYILLSDHRIQKFHYCFYSVLCCALQPHQTLAFSQRKAHTNTQQYKTGTNNFYSLHLRSTTTDTIATFFTFFCEIITGLWLALLSQYVPLFCYFFRCKNTAGMR